MLVLSCAELGFTVDTFQYKHRTHSWDSSTERSRIAFLIFSSVRGIALASVYIGFHFARKLFHSMHHTVSTHLVSRTKSRGMPETNVPGRYLWC